MTARALIISFGSLISMASGCITWWWRSQLPVKVDVTNPIPLQPTANAAVHSSMPELQHNNMSEDAPMVTPVITPASTELFMPAIISAFNTEETKDGNEPQANSADPILSSQPAMVVLGSPAAEGETPFPPQPVNDVAVSSTMAQLEHEQKIAQLKTLLRELASEDSTELKQLLGSFSAELL